MMWIISTLYRLELQRVLWYNESIELNSIGTDLNCLLQELGDQLSKFFSSETSLVLYQSTITKLLSFNEVKERAQIDPKKTLKVQRSLESASANAANQPKRATLTKGGAMDSFEHVCLMG